MTTTIGRGIVRGRMDRGELVRVVRGVYADQMPDAIDQMHAVFLRMPTGAALGGVSAAWLMGFADHPPVRMHIVVPPGAAKPTVTGVQMHEATLPVGEPVMVAGVPCLPPARCAVDLARGSDRPAGLAFLDAALRLELVDPDQLAAEVVRHRGLRGVCQARDLVALADARAECAQESHLRLLLHDARLPAPEPQLWVFDRNGQGRYRLDLGYREWRVGLEYDGASHLDPARLRRDRERMNWLAAEGWTMRYFTAVDLYRRPGQVAVTVRAALAQARRS